MKAAVGPYEHTGAYRPDAPAESPMAEPSGLWAVVEYTPAEHPNEPRPLLKAPGFGGLYWFSVGGEDGWGWDQVLSWPGTVRLVRDGISKDES